MARSGRDGASRTPSAVITSPVRPVAPKAAPSTVSRPEPVMPAIPVIWPARKSAEKPPSEAAVIPRSDRAGRSPPDCPSSPDSLSRSGCRVSASWCATASSPPTSRLTRRRWSREDVGTVATSRPSRSTVTFPAIVKISSSRWVTYRTPTPVAETLRMISISRSTSVAGRVAVGSSRTRRRTGEPGSSRRARAMATPVRVAGDRLPTLAPGSTARPTRARSFLARALLRRVEIVPSVVAKPAPMARLSSTGMLSTRPRSWWTKRAPSRYELAGCPNGSGWPATATVPASGRWKPERILMRVDFPDPFSPSTACTSPGPIARSTSWRATLAPKRLLSPVTARAGACRPVRSSGHPAFLLARATGASGEAAADYGSFQSLRNCCG